MHSHTAAQPLFLLLCQCRHSISCCFYCWESSGTTDFMTGFNEQKRRYWISPCRCGHDSQKGIQRKDSQLYGHCAIRLVYQLTARSAFHA